MPKMKTNKAAKKRFHVTGSGKLVRTKGPKSHLRRKKAKRVKRLFGGKVELDSTKLSDKKAYKMYSVTDKQIEYLNGSSLLYLTHLINFFITKPVQNKISPNPITPYLNTYPIKIVYTSCIPPFSRKFSAWSPPPTGVAVSNQSAPEPIPNNIEYGRA